MPFKIIYVGGFYFPEGDAGAARVLGIGKALRDAGFEVVFAGIEEKERAEDRQTNGSFVYQGFCYSSTGETHPSHVSTIYRLRRYLAGGKGTIDFLNSLNVTQIKAIIVYNPLTSHHLRFQRFCLLRRIPMVVDCTEWHAPTHYPGGRYGLHRWDVEIAMRYLNSRPGNLISISSYLERFYQERKVHTIRIPPLVDLADAKWTIIKDRAWALPPLRLVYAGNPGRKDILEGILVALKILRDEGKAVVLEMIGPTEKDITETLGNDSTIRKILNEAVIFHGRIAQVEVPRFLAQAHVGVLLRPNERYAQAGFPTKIVEYMAAGLPVIANGTSDIAEYVRKGIEGFMAHDNSAEAIAACVRQAIAVGPIRLSEMGLAARQRANMLFDYRNYITRLSDYFDQLLRLSDTR